MTHTILFLPGIMGSNLDLPDGERVWPPKPIETVLGYKRIEKLQSPDARPAGIIEKVACFGFYNTILGYFAQLGYGQSGAQRLLAMDYDWRRDLFDTADEIADRVTAALGTPGADDRLSIVGHSMGGLVGRLLLETGRYDDRAWFPTVDLFMTLSTPHLGAPLALARTLGLDNAVGISGKDFKTLSQNPDYPSGYQLLPAPGEEACWNVEAGDALEPIDIYDPTAAAALGLVPALVGRAKALHDAFAAGVPPEHVRYFYFAGTGHKTVSRVNVDGLGSTGVDAHEGADPGRRRRDGADVEFAAASGAKARRGQRARHGFPRRKLQERLLRALWAADRPGRSRNGRWREFPSACRCRNPCFTSLTGRKASRW